MTTTSREYAEALFELAVQGNVTEETSDWTALSAGRSRIFCWPFCA